MADITVVGSGPNGLTAAAVLARAGLGVHVVEGRDTIGGGTRTTELTLPGHRHDVCSAVHPLGIVSPAFAALGLTDHGVRWLHPEIPAAHPLDGRPAVLMHRDLDATVAGLGTDGTAYRRILTPLLASLPDLLDVTLRPVLPFPAHPLLAARFGRHGALSAAALVSRFDDDPARALFAGMAAHSIARLDAPMTSAVGLVLLAVGHHAGWPIVEGGSQRIADALASILTAAGGTIETGRWIRSRGDIATNAAMLDLVPGAVTEFAGDTPATKLMRRWRHGPGSFKIDWVLDGPIPWTDEQVAGAGTVHVGGTFEEIAFAESAVIDGHHPDRPFVLLSQPSRVDPSRAPDGHEIVWGYCHVPSGSDVDMTEAIERQVDRFAPGFRDRIIARHAMTAIDYEAYNPNNVGGDIAGGATTFLQTLLRPRPALNPYRVTDDIYMCSAATPPGAGTHGMCGHNAAHAYLDLMT
jgi:phytoene dehydrogenase-like protein